MLFRSLRLHVDLATDLPMLALDADRMQQVFLNLLLNARDAVGEGAEDGEIRIATRRTEHDVIAEIADNGAGIPEEILPRIFDPFFSTKARGKGTGLGLSVCQSIVTAHNGRITAANLERGAIFTLTFPYPSS